jgi:hypothetical protein
VPSQNPKKQKLIRGDQFTARIFKPYVIAIGELALAWNDLHETLGMLFLGHFSAEQSAAALWNSQNFDRQRRALLKAVAQNMSEKIGADYPRLRGDILWLLTEIDKLEDARNTVVHSPLLTQETETTIVLGLAIPKSSVLPNLRLGNTRATKLEKKDLLTEFRWCRDAALVLRDYALTLEWATMVDETPWPDRPSLPNRGQKRTRRDQPPPAQTE